MPIATRSGVIGFTDIHKSSLLVEFFFFFIADPEEPPRQQQQLFSWRQQQQWQHTIAAVRKMSRGSVSRTTRQMVLWTPWLCLSTTKLQSQSKKSLAL
uniref:Uncharacterized protein n=1 Tax=Fundulus heteroclitus TaxID=8078 RepID=A0A3Q2R230_FUNHE